MTSLALVLLLLAPPESLIQSRPDLPPRLRTPDAILDDYVKAIGGADAFAHHKTVHMKRKIEVKGMRIGGLEERYATSGDRTLSVTSLGGMGSFRQGSDGKVIWSEDPINGLRVLEGAEAEEIRLDGTWNAELKLKQLYTKVHAVQPPEPAPAGKKYECVELQPKVARPAVACFDAETHLRAFQKGTHTTAQGDVPYRVVFSDWREVKGMRIAYSEELTAGPMTLLGQITELKLDEKLDPKLFALPKAVKDAARTGGAAKKN